MEKALKLKLNTVYFAAYGAMAFYNPFLITYFNYRGLSFFEIGLLFAVLSLVGVICQPLWGYITDKYLNAKTTLAISMAASSICIVFVTLSHSFWSVLISIVVVAFFQSSIYSIMDAFCYELAEEYSSICFENVRIRGSLGYALSVAAAGMVIKYFGIFVSFYIYCIFSAASIIIINSISYKKVKTGSPLNLRDVTSLFKERRFTVFIISVAVLNVSMGANGSYISELIKQTGGDVSNLGFLWFIVAISEVPIFFLGGRILNMAKDLKLYYISIFFYIIRFLADSLCTTWVMAVMVQFLQSITFALYVISTLHYLNRIIDPKLRISGMTIFSAMGGGLGGFAGNLLGGIMLEYINIFYLFRILGAACAVSLGIGVFIEGKEPKKNKSRNLVSENPGKLESV